jgi:hypothetical protein
LVEQVMTSEPHASAGRVFWLVDNGSSHAGRASIERLEGAFENLRLFHLPIHASWLNQVELYFSILQRKALTPNDCGSLEEPDERLLAFGARYREIARPFDWTFTRADLERVDAATRDTPPGRACGSQPDRRAQAASRMPAGVRAAPALTATACSRLAAISSRDSLARSIRAVAGAWP